MKKSSIKKGFKFINSVGKTVEVEKIHGSGTIAQVKSEEWKTGPYHTPIADILEYFKIGHYSHIIKPSYEIY